MIWIFAFAEMIRDFAKNKRIFGATSASNTVDAPLHTESSVDAKAEYKRAKKEAQSAFNDTKFYRTYQTSQLGVVYTMNDLLRSAIISKGKLEEMEMHIAASHFFPHMFAHIGICVSLLSGNDLWYEMLVYLAIGFIGGQLLSLSSRFIIYNLIVNIIATFYNAIQRFFIVDIVLFALYVFYLKQWWRILVHISIFFVIQSIFEMFFHKERCKTLNRYAIHHIPELLNNVARKFADDINDSDDTLQSKTTPSDENRLAELEAELKKIPVAKVKQWYADGKLTEEQYKSIAKKYNNLRREINDIKERTALLQSLDEE